MTEAYKIPPRDAFNHLITNLNGYFVVAKVNGTVKMSFPEICVTCKAEKVKYSFEASSASPFAQPAGKLTWTCGLFGAVTVSGSRDTIIDTLIKRWEKK